MQRDGLPSVTLSVSLRQSVQRGKCKSDTARKQGSAGQPEMSATSASTDAIPSAVGSLSTAAKASTGATETGLERGPVSTAVCFEQRDWQFQEPQCAPSAMHVQRSSAPKFSRLRPQAGESLMLGYCTWLTR